MKFFQVLFSFLLTTFSLSCFAEADFQVPPLLESAGGHSIGLGNSIAAISGQGAVKNSPAMIALEKSYNVSAGYDWPAVGRPFYHLGAVDSKTSKIAAGVTYSSFQDDYLSWQENTEDPTERYYDAPINFRISGALAMAFEKVALGLGLQRTKKAIKAVIRKMCILLFIDYSSMHVNAIFSRLYFSTNALVEVIHWAPII